MRLVLPDALSDSEKVLFSQYERVLPASAVCTNVCVGGAAWDLRPLVLIKGRVWMYRFSRPFDDRTKSAILNEVQGFTVVPGWDMRFEAVAGLDRFVLIRPYFQSTLKDLLLRGELPTGERQLPLAKKLIDQVSALAQRKLAHGHICLSNITVVDDQIALLDPRIGLLNGLSDEYSAPESHSDQEPQNAADLYSMGRTLKVILGEAMTGRQRALVDQMLLPAPRQRPSLDEVRDAFLADTDRGVSSQRNQAGSSAGRVVSSGRKGPSTETATRGPTAAGGNFASVRMNKTTRVALLTAVALTSSLVLLRQISPSGYFRLARYLPLPVSYHDVDYEADWTSDDRTRMRRTARAAVIDLNPAAQNAIIENILDGANPKDIPVGIVKMGFRFGKDWLSHSDQDTMLALTVAPLLPEGATNTRPLSQLAPPVILALAGTATHKSLTKELKEVPLYTIEDLPDPVGPAFRYLREAGIENLGAPEAIGLSAIACGRVTDPVLNDYFGLKSETSEVLRRMANAVPLLGENEESARQMLAVLLSRGGDIGSVLGWFDIDDLARWSTSSAFDKLALLLPQLPARQLTLSQYADLLTFPVAEIRIQAADVLMQKFFKSQETQLLQLLAKDHNLLTRDQNLALISALSLPPEKRSPFITAWFQTTPAPDAVVLILLARASADSADLLNLEAARYLRKHEWSASLAMLKLMVGHPEALARSMAYSKLNPTLPEERALLQECLGKERDAALLKVIQLRLGV